jgi:dihydroorotase
LPGRVVATFHRGVPTLLDGAVRPAAEVAAASARLGGARREEVARG